jgi:hypothetical protein
MRLEVFTMKMVVCCGEMLFRQVTNILEEQAASIFRYKNKLTVDIGRGGSDSLVPEDNNLQ